MIVRCNPFTITRRLRKLKFKTPVTKAGTIEPWITPEMVQVYYENHLPPDGGERFPDIPGYLIYRDGRVLSCSHAKWKKPNLSRTGYYMHTFNIKGTFVIRSLGDIVLTTFVGPRPQGHEVNHLGDKQDNKLELLEWVTPKANIDHARHTGRLSNGGRPRVKYLECKLDKVAKV